MKWAHCSTHQCTKVRMSACTLSSDAPERRLMSCVAQIGWCDCLSVSLCQQWMASRFAFQGKLTISYWHHQMKRWRKRHVKSSERNHNCLVKTNLRSNAWVWLMASIEWTSNKDETLSRHHVENALKG